MKRVSIVGNAGAGKSHLGRQLASLLGVPHVELDALYHQENWRPRDTASFEAAVSEVAAGESWVIDGNYSAVVINGPVWRRADTVVWLDLPRAVVMAQVVSRSARRVLLRTEPWNGNRERLANVLSWSPQRSIIRWSWTQHERHREVVAASLTAPEHAHLQVIRLVGRKEISGRLAVLAAEAERPSAAP